MFPTTTPFNARFFPQHILFLTVGDNTMPMGYWIVVSKSPFRFLICMGVGNHSLTLLKKYKEAALHFMPSADKELTLGNHPEVNHQENNSMMETSGRLFPINSIYETVLHQELPNLSTEFVLYAMDVVALHGKKRPIQRQPIFYLSGDDFATTGESWRHKR
jgi:hypothetical protein